VSAKSTGEERIMIVRLISGGDPEVIEGTDLTELEVVADGPDALGQGLGSLGRVDPDGEHVWLAIDTLGAASDPGDDPGWSERFQGMIAYAEHKGWLDPSGAALRAHIVFQD
jgi:hypothetical protein